MALGAKMLGSILDMTESKLFKVTRGVQKAFGFGGIVDTAVGAAQLGAAKKVMKEISTPLDAAAKTIETKFMTKPSQVYDALVAADKALRTSSEILNKRVGTPTRALWTFAGQPTQTLTAWSMGQNLYGAGLNYYSTTVSNASSYQAQKYFTTML